MHERALDQAIDLADQVYPDFLVRPPQKQQEKNKSTKVEARCVRRMALMTTVDVGRPRNGNAFCGRYARPASRFPARPGALPCSLRRIPFDRPAMLRMYRGLDGRSTLSRCRVQEPSAAEGSQCDAVALAGSPCHQWLCGHKQGWPGPSFDHMSGLRHRRDIPLTSSF